MVSRVLSAMKRLVMPAVLTAALVGATSPDGVVRAWSTGSAASVAAQPTTAAQDEFVPIDELPPDDRLPAAPFLVAAYTVTLLLLVGYVWLLWRRLDAVQRELRAARAARGTGGVDARP